MVYANLKKEDVFRKKKNVTLLLSPILHGQYKNDRCGITQLLKNKGVSKFFFLEEATKKLWFIYKTVQI